MIGHVGSYVIHRELGRGGMGAVYVATHALLGRTAAVKVLLPEWSRSRDIVQRFFNEARATTAIRHPGIVEVYDFGWASDGSAYLVMEYLEGEPLSARLARRGRVPVSFALGVARQIASALAAAHRVGIVHRDLKPDNVFLVPDEESPIGARVKLLDFGIAKLGDGPVGAPWRTSNNAIMGTPPYMSPEQARGAAHVDHRSDLYSLGCILFEMCCGRLPFGGTAAVDVIGAHLHDPPPPPRAFAPDLPRDVEAMILRLLEKRADQRYATAELVVREAAALASHHEAASRVTTAMPVMLPLPAPAEVVALPPGRRRRRGAPRTTLEGAAGETTRPASASPRRHVRMVVASAAVIAAAAVTLALVTPSTREAERTSVAADVAAGALDLSAVAPPPVAVDAAVAAVVALAPDAAFAVAPDAAVAVDTRAVPPRKPPRPRGTPPQASVAATPPDDAADLVGRATAAARNSQYARALQLCEAALTLEPQRVDAQTTCAIAACNLKLRERARRYIDLLPESRAAMARQVCLRNGVGLVDDPALRERL